ncbi:hypothetical protein V2J09_004656 [Rumex salicifolius]
MAPSFPSSSSSSSCSSNSPHLPPHRSHHFTPIEEGDESEECYERRRPGSTSSRHHPSPLHASTPASATTATITTAVGAGKQSGKKRSSEKVAVICNNCRPTSRDKTTTSSVVPVADAVSKQYSSSSSYSLSMPSPNAILKSILAGVARRSPKPSPDTSSSASIAAVMEERWKIAVAELSHKLVHASRKRDEAVLEASKLKYSMAELEKKLNKLEIYCHNLKSGLEVCSAAGGSSVSASPGITGGVSIVNNQKFSPFNHLRIDEHDQIIENFLISVSDARSAVRFLSRALTVQIRQMGVKVFDRIASLFQPYDVKISLSKNPRNLISYLEALLNLALFEDFESTGFTKNSTNRIMNPLDRCEAQYAAFSALRSLTWEEVLSKGTKHFSEDFSKFCDRKMSEIVGLLGWNRAWPEPLLQAFFGASKTVWLVHLLANSVHPGLPVFRVEKGSGFDPLYMEDMSGDQTAHRLVPTVVRIMVAPGFYVYDNVVKCKVLCRYHSSSVDGGASVMKGLSS